MSAVRIQLSLPFTVALNNVLLLEMRASKVTHGEVLVLKAINWPNSSNKEKLNGPVKLVPQTRRVAV